MVETDMREIYHHMGEVNAKLDRNYELAVGTRGIIDAHIAEEPKNLEEKFQPIHDKIEALERQVAFATGASRAAQILGFSLVTVIGLLGAFVGWVLQFNFRVWH